MSPVRERRSTSWIPPTLISPPLLPPAGAVDEQDLAEAVVSSLKHLTTNVLDGNVLVLVGRVVEFVVEHEVGMVGYLGDLELVALASFDDNAKWKTNQTKMYGKR